MDIIGSVSPISSAAGSGKSAEQVRQVFGLTPHTKNGNGEPGADSSGTAKSPGAKATTRKVQGGSKSAQSAPAENKGLTQQQLVEVQKLKSIDRTVRAHEEAHMAMGGSLVNSGPTYEYRSGPDGNLYAVGGEVGIDASPVSGDPAATISKEERVQRAALAPADPSSQDQRVAAEAAKLEMDARLELAQQSYSQRGTQPDAATSTQTVKA